MIEFYKRGDCVGIITAEEQLKNKAKWEEEAKITYWKSVKEVMIDKINQIWRLGPVDFLENDWFPGYNLFLMDLQANGYHVYEGNPIRVDGEMDKYFQPVFSKRFIISLDEINDPKVIIREVNTDA